MTSLNPPARLSSSLLRMLAGTLAVVAMAHGVGCSSTTTVAPQDDGATDLDPLVCELAKPGSTFSFTINNTGTRNILLSYGCGTQMPIELSTTAGMRGIGPGNADFCETPCEYVYDGNENWGCSDCGPGVGDLLLPGESLTIEWDRRVWAEHVAPADCTTAEQRSCALGTPIDATETLAGNLTICPTEFEDVNGYCFGGDTEDVPFMLDPTKDELTIDVQ